MSDSVSAMRDGCFDWGHAAAIAQFGRWLKENGAQHGISAETRVAIYLALHDMKPEEARAYQKPPETQP